MLLDRRVTIDNADVLSISKHCGKEFKCHHKQVINFEVIGVSKLKGALFHVCMNQNFVTLYYTINMYNVKLLHISK